MTEASPRVAARLVVGILSGPIAFLIVWLIPLAGLNPQAHFGLSVFAWTLAWWVLTPVPWAVTGFLPLVLFPLGGVMSFAATAALYGQRVLPFVLGVMLFGHAFQKHGLARRMSPHRARQIQRNAGVLGEMIQRAQRQDAKGCRGA